MDLNRRVAFYFSCSIISPNLIEQILYIILHKIVHFILTYIFDVLAPINRGKSSIIKSFESVSILLEKR